MSRHHLVLLICTVALFAVAPRSAMAGKRNANATSSRLVQPGDELVVVVPEPVGPDGSASRLREFRVSVDVSGEIALALYGRIHVAGLSERKLRHRVRKHLRRWVRGPVSVVVARRRVKVVVTGCIKRPGPLSLHGSATVWEALRAAGGLTKGGRLDVVTLIRGGKRRVVDVHAWLTRRTNRALPTLASGDLIFVPAEKGLALTANAESSFLDATALKSRVIVIGAVRNPGVFPRTRAIDVLHALALAGGATKDADLSQLRVVCRGLSHRVNALRALQIEPRDVTKPAPKVEPLPSGTGVIVYVPSTASPLGVGLSQHVIVLGAVKSPGPKAVGGPIRLVDALALAGGPVEEGAVDNVRVVQERPRISISMNYDIERYAKEGGPAGAARIGAGDFVYVGFNNNRVISKALSAVSSLAVLAAAASLLTSI